jgi:hypothetical protein
MTEDPRQILKAARHAARQGAHAEALEKYLWFHRHALDHNLALGGVRLSYAIAEWFELGKVYPPARDALESVQAETLRSLQAGSNDRREFHDFAAINERLGRSELTSSVFREIAERQPEFAKECFRLALRSLIRTRDFALARRFATSPKERLDSHLAWFAKVLLNERRPSLHDDAFIGIYARSVRELSSVFEGVGEHEEAELLQSKAIEELANPSDREELRRQLLWR